MRSAELTRRLLATGVSSPLLSRLTGRLADLRLPSWLLVPLIAAYARHFGVALDEAADSVDSYPTFNAFFTRRLREGARPVADGPGLVVSPSDSRLSGIGPLPPDQTLEQIKGHRYTIGALLGSAEDAAAFRTGVQATLYLGPGMYHRVHSPVDGEIRAWRYVPGRLFPVNPPAVRSIPGLFTRNERVALFLESPSFGPVALVLVGAANVGRITLAFADLVTNTGAAPARVRPQSPIPVRPGQELATFNLGSTVVLLVADPSLLPVGLGAGDLVRMGQALWRRR